MLSYKDRTFCNSPNCKNECGRQLDYAGRQDAINSGLFVSYAYFCDIPDDPDDIWDTKKDE